MITIPFNKPPFLGDEIEYIKDALENKKLSGDGVYNDRCQKWFAQHYKSENAYLTPSGTASLEMAAILLDVKLGDEIIMPSYTFVSTANAFVLRGARIVFVDIMPDSMNISPQSVVTAISEKTKAIVVVHYAGNACDMDELRCIAAERNIPLIEDAAQAIGSTYKNKFLGTISDIGCLSFHDTKNLTSGGEGGAIIINNQNLIERAEIIREKGTNRSAYMSGFVDKYTWCDIGSSFLLNDISAAFLFRQLENLDKINNRRRKIWNVYYDELSNIPEVNIPGVDVAEGNGHIFYFKLPTKLKRNKFISFMKEKGIQTPFHYIPLHSSPFGCKHGTFAGIDLHTTRESEKLVRLPLYYNMTQIEQSYVIEKVKLFFNAE